MSTKINLILILTALLMLTTPTLTTKPPYSTHCNSLIPSSPPTTSPPAGPTPSFQFSASYFTGGDRILSSPYINTTTTTTFPFPKSISFKPTLLLQTLTPDTVRLAGILIFRGGGGGFRLSDHRNRRKLRIRISPRNPKVFNQRGRVSFELKGFWSRSSGMLCMVGSGVGRSLDGNFLELNAVFKMNYKNSSNIESSVVSGVVESVDELSSLNWFEPIRVLGLANRDYRDYEFTKVEEAEKLCSGVEVEEKVLGGEENRTCGFVDSFFMQKFRLEYGSGCANHYCGPLDRGLGFKPSFMSLRDVKCYENGRVKMYVRFWDRQYYGFLGMLDPDKSLVAEGVWDREKRRLCVVACRVMNVSGNLLGESNVGDCMIGVSLWFPSVLSIERSNVVRGRVWSGRDKNDPEYFDMVSFGNVENGVLGFSGAKYNYTQLVRVEKYCARGDAKKIGEKKYPDMRNMKDMRIDMSLTDAEGKSAWGYANLLFVGENFYNTYPPVHMPSPLITERNQSFWNVSYKIGYTFTNASAYAYQATEISAEGTYDSQTGMLCMVGCMRADSLFDCEVIINIQLAPLNPQKGEHLTGTVKSLRKSSDPLFFKPLDVASYGIYKTQAAETAWLIDIEIIMVLISLTFLCIFIGLQLSHVKKNPELLPSVSITMLAILTLGYMIPLVLNFEASFFKNRNQKNVLLKSGEWLQVNEVLVRVITMVAFLLQVWLLQAAWSSRSAYENKKSLWVTERKALLCCLPLYLIGLVIALLVHFRSVGNQKHSPWEDTMSYAGFILDNFLLPQFIFNIFWNSKDKSLAPSFYIGTTIVRALPHIYDAYRTRHYVPRLDSSYIYARQDGDLYSSAWDIIIPCEGVVMVLLIYLQQRFGGVSVLPKKFKEISGYEMVPVETH